MRSGMPCESGFPRLVGWLALGMACLTIARAQSSLDEFNPGADREVYAIAVQLDGKILVGEAGSALWAVSRAVAGRLNADRRVDTTLL